MRCSHSFCNFLNASWSCGLWGCQALPAILPQSPHLCQNGHIWDSSSIRETEKKSQGQVIRVGWVANDSEMVCYDATASSFVAKVLDEVFAHFHAVTVKRHSSMRKWLFGLPGWMLYEQSPWCQRKLWACSWLCSSPVLPFFFFCLSEFGRSVYGSCYLLQMLANHARVSIALFPTFEQNLMLFLRQLHRKIASE
jgi:hypothetical protein